MRLLHCICRLLALSGHAVAKRLCPLSGTKRTFGFLPEAVGPCDCRRLRRVTFAAVYFRSAKGWVISRALSMKSCATGLRVRFLRVTTLVDDRGIGSSTGNTFKRTLGGVKRRNMLPWTPRK